MKPTHFLTLLFVIIGYFTYKVFAPYIGNITIAALLGLATYKINRLLLKKIPGRVLPALLASFALGILFFAPIIYIITNAASFVAHLDFNAIQHTISTLKSSILHFIDTNEYLKNSIIKDYAKSIDIGELFNTLVQFATLIGAKSANFFKDVILILIFYFFVHLYGPALLQYLKELIPFTQEESETIFENLTGTMGVVFNSILATAIFEGALFGLIAYYYGYNGLMLGILYGFASLIPVVGGVIMWLPLSIHLYLTGHTKEAIGLALYSIVVISIIADTFIKPIIIRFIDDFMTENQEIKVNEMLIFFAIIAGMSSYGFWGMIIGPAVVTLLISILDIYKKLLKAQ